MLLKKSAFDVLMNKSKPNIVDKLKETAKKAQTSDSDSDVQIVDVIKTKSKKLNEDLIKIEDKPIKQESIEIVSSFTSQDILFTATQHTTQLSTQDYDFLQSIKHPKIEFKQENKYDINSIKFNELLLNITVKEEEDEESNTDNKRRGRHKRKKTKEIAVEPIEIKYSRSKEDNHDLWTEKYQYKNEDDIVTNSSQIERLKEWLNNWKSILSNEVQYAKDKYNDSGSEYSYESDCSNTDSSSGFYKKKFYTNAILLSGPYGCGKTSSVHCIAKQLGFKIFEVNSSSLRCKTQILQELDGAMNSHHVSSTNNQKPTNEILNMFNKKKAESITDLAKFKIDKFFKSSDLTSKPETKTRKKRKISLRKETVLSVHSKTSKRTNKKYKKDTEQNQSEEELEDIADIENKIETIAIDSNEENSVNIHKESLILFDEIDVVFREDVGFLAAINHFIKKSKKPIILTTNDDFLQDKINLNIEKIHFVRPRVDAAMKYLKKISKLENYDLDTPSAYTLIQDCKCDMRRALLQLQATVSSSLQTPLSKHKYELNNLNNYLPDALKQNDKPNYFDNFFFIDQLTKKLKSIDSFFHVEIPHSFKKYDLVLLKDGLSDNSTTCTNTSTFNPFLPVNSLTMTQDHSDDLISLTEYDRLYEFYEEYMTLLNTNLIDFKIWSKHGLVDQFNYSANSIVNKFAQNMMKSTSSREVSLDYRPFLQKICQIEEINKMNSKRRYLHYLNFSSLGLLKEDCALLAKSNLAPKVVEITTNTTDSSSQQYVDDDVFSDK